MLVFGLKSSDDLFRRGRDFPRRELEIPPQNKMFGSGPKAISSLSYPTLTSVKLYYVFERVRHNESPPGALNVKSHLLP